MVLGKKSIYLNINKILISINQYIKHRWTILHFACQLDRPIITQNILYLVYSGINKEALVKYMNQETIQGYTPGEVCTMGDCSQSLQTLIDAGGIDLKKKN